MELDGITQEIYDLKKVYAIDMAPGRFVVSLVQEILVKRYFALYLRELLRKINIDNSSELITTDPNVDHAFTQITNFIVINGGITITDLTEMGNISFDIYHPEYQIREGDQLRVATITAVRDKSLDRTIHINMIFTKSVFSFETKPHDNNVIVYLSKNQGYWDKIDLLYQAHLNSLL